MPKSALQLDFCKGNRMQGILKVPASFHSMGITLDIMISANEMSTFSKDHICLFQRIGQLMCKVMNHKNVMDGTLSPRKLQKEKSFEQDFYFVLGRIKFAILELVESCFQSRLECHLERKYPGWLSSKKIQIFKPENDIHDIVITSKEPGIQPYLLTFHVDNILQEVKKFVETLKKVKGLSSMCSTKNLKIVMSHSGGIYDIKVDDLNHLDDLFDLKQVKVDSFNKTDFSIFKLLNREHPQAAAILAEMETTKPCWPCEEPAPYSGINKAVIDDIIILEIDLQDIEERKPGISLKDKVLNQNSGGLIRLRRVVREKIINVNKFAKSFSPRTFSNKKSFNAFIPGSSSVKYP